MMVYSIFRRTHMSIYIQLVQYDLLYSWKTKLKLCEAKFFDVLVKNDPPAWPLENSGHTRKDR